MSSWLQAIAEVVREHGLTLMLGTTLVLAVFALLVRCTRSLSKKNGLASTAMLAVAAYVIVAVTPLPRFGPDLTHTSDTTATPTAMMPAKVTAAKILELPSAATGATLPNIAAPLTRSHADLPVDLATVLAAIMALGALFFTAHLLLGWWRLRRILAKTQSASADLKRLVHLPARTRLRITNTAVRPFCCGWLRPTIVLPSKLANASDETRFVLLHERAHLTSGDTRARLLAALLRPLLFWHPLYWWLQRELRFTSELLADDAAAEGSVAAYVRCMMTLSTDPDPAAGGALVATIFQRKSELFRRLEMMLQRNETITRSHSTLSRWTRAVSAGALVVLCAGTFGIERVVAQSPGGNAVREEIQALQAELARLRTEITSLRGQTSAQTGGSSRSHAPRRPAAKVTGSHGVAPAASPTEPPIIDVFADTRFPTAKGDSSTERDQWRTRSYVVKSGDSFAKIAQRHFGSRDATRILRRLNPDVDTGRLRIGQRLTVADQGSVNGQAPRLPKDTRAKQAPTPSPASRGGWQGTPKVAPPTPSQPSATGALGRPPTPAASPVRVTPQPSGPVASPRPFRTTTRSVRSTHSLSDMANLVTRCIELGGDVEIQEIKVQHADSDEKHAIAMIQLRTKKSQHRAIRDLIAQELSKAKIELKRARQLAKKGLIRSSELLDNESKIALLARALR